MPHIVASDGVGLDYETVGTGPPLVLQTGGAGDGSMWRDAGYIEALSSVHRCVLLDHRGHGRSGQPPLAQAHKMERYAADVVDVLDHAGIERTAFWGYSQGGEIGLALSALFPGRITALITTGVISNRDRMANAADNEEGITALRDGGWAGFLDPPALSSMPAWFQRQVQATNPEMLALWFEAYADWNPWELLPEIAIPILMFVGELEDPEDWNSRAAELAPNARVVRLAALDHLGAYVRCDLVVPIAKEFLAGT
jgi:pimeloyl-ACP methyl ester carboxylesterase